MDKKDECFNTVLSTKFRRGTDINILEAVVLQTTDHARIAAGPAQVTFYLLFP